MRKMIFFLFLILFLNFISFRIRDRAGDWAYDNFLKIETKFVGKLIYYSSFNNKFANPEKLNIPYNDDFDSLRSINYFLKKLDVSKYDVEPIFYGEWQNNLLGLRVDDRVHSLTYYFYFAEPLTWSFYRLYSFSALECCIKLPDLMKFKRVIGFEVCKEKTIHEFVISPFFFLTNYNYHSGMLLCINEKEPFKKYIVQHCYHREEDPFKYYRFSKVFSIDNVSERFRDKIKLTFREYAEYYFYVLLENYFGELEIIWKFVWAIFVGIVVWKVYKYRKRGNS